MERRRMLFCLVLFLLLTALKFLLPGQAAAWRARAQSALGQETDTALLVQTLGQDLAEEGVRKRLSETFGWGKQKELDEARPVSGEAQDEPAAETKAPEAAAET